jgi:hypothetical protein
VELPPLDDPLVMTLGVVKRNNVTDVRKHRGISENAVARILQESIILGIPELHFQIQWFFAHMMLLTPNEKYTDKWRKIRRTLCVYFLPGSGEVI